MAGKIVDRLPHSCGASRALNVFENEDGTYSGYCFSCKTTVKNPYEDKERGYKPETTGSNSKRTPEQIKKELTTIQEKFPVRALADRKISLEVCEHLGIKVGVSQENGYDITSHFYPYYKDGELQGYKVRTVEDKNFFGMGNTSDVEPFGYSQAMKYSLSNSKVFVVEGECFEPNTEVFTNKGWVKFKDISKQGSDLLVGQVEPDTGVMSYTPTFKYIEKPFKGDLIKMSVKGYEVTTTPKHSIAYIGNNGKWLKQPANEHSSKGWGIPRVSYLEGKGTGLSDTQKKLVLAICADGSLTYNQDGTVHVRFAVDKERKATRIQEILDTLEVRYNYTYNESRKCKHYFGFQAPEYAQTKEIPVSWVTDATLEERIFILKELAHWDGNFVKNRNQTEYSSKHESECVKVQTLAHTAGVCSTVMERSNVHGTWYKTSILWGKKHTSNQNTVRENIPYDGKVYCVGVPTGYIQVRCNGKVSIVGNCDVASIIECFMEHGTKPPSVISIPNGAGSVGKISKYIDNLKRSFKNIVLVMDNDDAGNQAVQDFIKLCPEVLVAKLPLKDPNDMLVAGRSAELFKAIQWDAKPQPSGKSVRTDDDSLWEKASKPIPYGIPWPWPSFTAKTRGIRRKEVYYIAGAQKIGKSCIVNEVSTHLGTVLDTPVFLVKPEEAIVGTLKRLAGVAVSKIFHDPDVPYELEDFYKGRDVIGDNFIIFDKTTQLNWEDVKKEIRYNVVTLGCQDVFIDPLTCFTTGMDTGEQNKVLTTIASELQSLAMDLNFTAYVFCHLNKPEGKKDHARGGAISTKELAGSSAMGRFGNMIIGFEGNKDPDLPEEVQNTRYLNILDEREYGIVGKVQLYYNKETGRLLEPQQH